MSAAVAAYRRAFTMRGRRVTLERKVPNAAPVTVANVRARIVGATPEEIAGGMKSTERHVLILAEDVPPSFAPLRQNDRVVLDGLTLTFTSRPDDQTRRDGEVLLAYEGIAVGS